MLDRYVLQCGIQPRSWESQQHQHRILAIPRTSCFLELNWYDLPKAKNVELFLQTSKYCSKDFNDNWCNIVLLLEMSNIYIIIIIIYYFYFSLSIDCLVFVHCYPSMTCSKSALLT